MIRTTDDPHPEPFRPLGETVPPPPPPAPPPKRIAPGVVEVDGKWRTDLPLPKGPFR